jgi:hypothetical protein
LSLLTPPCYRSYTEEVAPISRLGIFQFGEVHELVGMLLACTAHIIAGFAERLITREVNESLCCFFLSLSLSLALAFVCCWFVYRSDVAAQQPFFGVTYLHTAVLFANMAGSFALFGICLSYLNAAWHKLANKRLLLELFDSLMDVGSGAAFRPSRYFSLTFFILVV